MKNRLLVLLMAISLLAGVPMMAYADTGGKELFKVGSFRYYVLNQNEVAVAVGGGNANEIVIPQTIEYEGNTYSVTSIHEYTFLRKNPSSYSVTVPSTVTSIGQYAIGYWYDEKENYPQTKRKIDGVTIIGEEGSEAQKYAEENGFTFVAAGESGHKHSMTHTAAKESTCTTAGNIEYWTCSECKKVFSDASGTNEITAESTVVKASGHSYGAWKTTKKATELAAGQKTRTCPDCKKVEKKTIKQLKPSLPAVAIVKPASSRKAATVKWKEVSAEKRKKIASIQIQYSLDKKFKKGVKTTTAKKTVTLKKITKLTSNKTYYVRIRAYKKDSKGVHVSKWSSVKVVRVK